MGNLLRDIFDPNSEYNKQIREKLKNIEREMIENRDCCYCKNAIHPPHIEMGRFAGTDTYCRIMKEYKHYGDTCLLYNFNEIFKEKQMENVNCEKCEYYDSEDNVCTWLSCDGLDCYEELPCESEDKEQCELKKIK